MRRTCFAIVLATVLLSSRLALQANDLIYVRFGDYLDSLRVQAGVPGLAAAIVGPTDIVWERSFGFQDVDRALPMRIDTPVHLDGITQVFTATTLLRCAEEGRLSLDDRIGMYATDAPEPGATIRQLLTHTSGGATLNFTYRPERLDVLAEAVQACTREYFRETAAQLFDQLSMIHSVPGVDAVRIVPPQNGALSDSARQRYTATLSRLATPYAVDAQKRATASQYASTGLTASQGVVSSAWDFAQFDRAIKSGLLLRPESVAEAWRTPDDGAGRLLPHGLGWFVQIFNGELVVWQYGSGGELAGASSLVITLPARGITLILVANSTGLVKSFPLANGDVTTSPFGRAFLALFTK
jgi:CubicO group peptidase (beta-lactamase class C family)